MKKEIQGETLAMSWGKGNLTQPERLVEVKNGKLVYISDTLVIIEDKVLYPKNTKTPTDKGSEITK